MDTPDLSPEPYRPANGLEGAGFMEQWCARCKRDAAFQADPENNDGCDIAANTMLYDEDDPLYPKEWVYNSDDEPICTAFEADNG